MPPSGRICHSVCPASASQSTKRAAAPRSPEPCGPGSEVGCSRRRRRWGSLIGRRSFRAGRSGAARVARPPTPHRASAASSRALSIRPCLRVLRQRERDVAGSALAASSSQRPPNSAPRPRPRGSSNRVGNRRAVGGAPGEWSVTPFRPRRAAVPAAVPAAAGGGAVHRDRDGVNVVISAGVGLGPGDPARRVVLAIGVVVAALGVAELVARGEHRRALRQQQRGEQRGCHAGARRAPPRRRSVLDAAVRAVVGAWPSWLCSPLASVVAALVAHQVAQREAVVRDVMKLTDSAGARPWRWKTSLEAHRRARTRRPPPRQPVPAHVVAEAVVPFAPAAREVAEAVAAVAEVPRLGDELQPGEHRVLRHREEERRRRRTRHRRGRAPAPGRSGKPSTFICLRPPAQAVHHELQHPGWRRSSALPQPVRLS